MYRINEIFYSLQGEGYHVGTPAVFVRFSGCNLRCPFCDTDFSASVPMSVEQIVDKVESYPSRFAVLTGGEPTLQADAPLIDALHEAGFYVTIETNGTHAVAGSVDWITLSPKPDSSLSVDVADELKVVYTGQDVEQYLGVVDAKHHYLQPCSIEQADGSVTDNREAVIDYCLHHPHWHLSMQMHKLIDIK